MKTTARSNRSGMVQRGAFTMIELLVVITIIVALMALSASAVLKFIQVQQNNNTQSTLDRVQAQLMNAWSKVKDQALKDNAALVSTYAGSLAGTDPNASGRAQVIYIKLKLRQAFPMSFNEALNPAPLPPLPGYVTYLNSKGITGSSAATANIESSACLLMALQRGVSGAGINPSELTSGGAAGNYNGIPYLTDAWGRPIFFSRVPSGCPVLNPTSSGPQPGANDPGDPQGYLNSPQWVGTNFSLQFTALTLQPVFPGASFKLAPMVASGGPLNWLLKPWINPSTGVTNPPGTPPFDPITFTPVSGMGAMYSTLP